MAGCRVATALFTFIVTWNEYFYALILVNTDEARPLTTGVITMLIRETTYLVAPGNYPRDS